MACKSCKKKPAVRLSNSNVDLCKKHFLEYFQKKVFKTIRQYNLINEGDHIGVAVSGGKDSLTLLYLMSLFLEKRRKIKLTAILVDEGIDGYRDLTIKDAKKWCNELNIPLKIFSYKKEIGKKLDDILKETKEKSCSICGVFRRYLLNKSARELKIDKLATGHNLDDEVQSIVMNQLKNQIKISARLGPITGVKEDKRFVRRIKPLYFLTEKEVMTYAYLKGLTSKFNECPHSNDSFRGYVMDWINHLEEKFPGSKHAILNSFLEIMPLLKKDFEVGEIKECKECGEPCSGDICQKCNIVKRILK